MEEDKLKRIFAEFEPELSSDSRFIDNIERNISAVETARQQIAMVKSRCRIAVVIASLAGFIVGFLFSLAMPYLGCFVESWSLSLHDSTLACQLADNFMIIAWMATAIVSIFTALNAYDISLSLIKLNDKQITH